MTFKNLEPRRKPACPSCEGGIIGVDDICTDCIIKINVRSDLKTAILNYLLLNNGASAAAGSKLFSSLKEEAGIVAKNIMGVLDQTKLSIDKIRQYKDGMKREEYRQKTEKGSPPDLELNPRPHSDAHNE